MSRAPLVLLLLLPALLAQDPVPLSPGESQDPVPLSPGESDPPQEDPVDGGYTDYSEWEECAVTCGGGQQTRTRTCTSPAPARGGAECVGEASESQTCNSHPCPVDGGYTDYSEWEECSVTCGGGQHTRTRTCTSPAPARGGAECIGETSESQTCNAVNCSTTEANPKPETQEPPQSPVLFIEIDDSGTATCTLLHYNETCDFEMLIGGEVVAEATDVSVSYTNENTTTISCTADCYDGLEFSADYPQEDWGPSISMQTLIIIIVVAAIVLILVVGILVYFVCKRRNRRPKHQPLSDKQVEDYEMENEAPESKMME